MTAAAPHRISNDPAAPSDRRSSDAQWMMTRGGGWGDSRVAEAGGGVEGGGGWRRGRTVAAGGRQVAARCRVELGRTSPAAAGGVLLTSERHVCRAAAAAGTRCGR